MYSEKQQAVLAKAKGVFLRYGYKRVTMNELAAASGISRPGLYLMFSSKEDVFLGVARQEVAAMFETLDDGLGKQAGVLGKLRYLFEVWTVRPFEMISESPEARDLFECEFDFAQEVAAEANLRFETLVATTLREGRFNPPRGQTAEAAAHVLRCAAYGFKRQAATSKELEELIDSMLALLPL